VKNKQILFMKCEKLNIHLLNNNDQLLIMDNRLTKDSAWFSGGSIPETTRTVFREYMVKNHGTTWNDQFDILCPTAGDNRIAGGYFQNVHAYDRNPQHESVTMCDFQNIDVSSLERRIVVLENPPFSAHIAVKFFNKMAEFANVDIIAIVFPDKYRGNPRDAYTKRVMNRHFHCVSHRVLPSDEFEDAQGVSVKMLCTFQVWVRKPILRDDSVVGLKFGVNIIGRPDFWIRVFNPTTKSRKRRKVITKFKPVKGNGIPVQVHEASTELYHKKRIECAMVSTYTNHAHTDQGFNEGNLINSLRDE
jgi:hypothetical protein